MKRGSQGIDRRNVSSFRVCRFKCLLDHALKLRRGQRKLIAVLGLRYPCDSSSRPTTCIVDMDRLRREKLADTGRILSCDEQMIDSHGSVPHASRRNETLVQHGSSSCDITRSPRGAA